MPLVHRNVTPRKLSSTPLNLGKTDSEFIAVNNGTLVNVLRQLASLVLHAKDVFGSVLVLTEEVNTRVRTVKIRLDELEFKAELYDPKLVPVPEGSLDDDPVSFQFREPSILNERLFLRRTRPLFLLQLYEKAGKHESSFPPRSPMPLPKLPRRSTTELHNLREQGRRPASFVALRDWKLDDYLDEEIATLNKKKTSTPDDLNRTVSLSFPGKLVQVDVTGRGFDRMKANRRSLVIHTKKVRMKKKRRNTICGSLPNKECGIQTSFSSVASPSDNTKKYGIDSGHWSSCTGSAQGCVEAPSSSSAPSPWEPNSLSTSSDFLFDDEDRSLTPQLENFTDGLVSDSDSVDTEGYFTSFRNECGFPKSKKLTKEKEEKGSTTTPSIENEYELFGKGSTSTTASSCGTVVLRNKPDPPARTTSAEHLIDKKLQSEDAGWEERVKRKSLIERVPSLVVVTPSPSCSSASPPPLKDPGHVLDSGDRESGNYSLKAEDSESGTLSDTDSDNHDDIIGSDMLRASSTSSTTSSNSTLTLTGCTTNLPQPDVIPDVQQLQIIRTAPNPKLDIGKQYFSLDTVLLGSSPEDHHESELKTNLPPANSAKIRGARVVLDANGEIIFSSETLRRKRRQKVSFDPGSAVKPVGYDNGSCYSRVRESVYDRIKKDETNDEKLYECIEEIRRRNLEESDAAFKEKSLIGRNSLSDKEEKDSIRHSPSPCVHLSPNHAVVNVLLETDLDSAIPPVMPELKTLPKIKDRLKRNESYRIATDELPPRLPSLSLNKKLPLNNHNHNNNNNINKKRDIPEEDPVFIQQILNLSNSSNPSARSPDPFGRSITLSKLALSADDRPSFLRRESPPTMDDIAKEIYRFRKKFNIQPNALSRNNTCLNSPPKSTAISSSSSSSSNVISTPSNSSYHSGNQEKSKMNLSPPLSSSTPLAKPNTKYSAFSQLFRSNSSCVKPLVRQSLFSKSRVFPANTNKTSSPTPMQTNEGRPPSVIGFEKVVPPKPKSETSLTDFKKLLQLTKQSKRNSISAVETLKPKLLIETRI